MQIAISSWSVHGLLGQAWHEPDANGTLVNRNALLPADLTLLELPAFIAKDGIHVLEICHFHFPSVNDAYLGQLKAALQDAGVTLANVLIDTGNLSNPDDAQWCIDIELNKRWQDVAAKVGAKGVRIDCGTEPATPETIQRSATALRELADYGASLDLITTIENWRETSIYPDDLLAIMREVDRPLNLCVDFGNAEKTDDKQATLKALLPHGTSIHCKGRFQDGELDTEEFKQSLALAKEANFDGHITLIGDGIKDEWDKILILKQVLQEAW